MKKLKDVKTAVCSAALDTAAIYRDAFERLKRIDLHSYLGKTASALVICAAFVLFSLLRNGVGNLYMTVFLPLFFADALIILFGEIYHPSGWMSLFIAFLLTAGTALQIFMLSPDDPGINRKLISHILFVFAAVILALILYPWLANICSDKRNKRTVRILLVVITVVLYLILLVFGGEANGTKAWLYLTDSFSLQITDFTKLISICFFALCISDDKLTDKKKTVSMFTMLCLNAVFLVIVNELGTLLIISLTLFLLQLIYLKRKRFIIAELAVLLTVCLVVTGGSFLVYKSVGNGETQITAEKASQLEEEQNLRAVQFLQEQDPNIGYEDMPAELPEETTPPQDTAETQHSESLMQKALNRFARIYPKISSRVSVLFHSEEASQDDSYQIDNAFRALATSSWFGTPRGSLKIVPEINCDFIFVDLVVRMGIVGAALVLLSLAVILVGTVTRVSTKKNPYEASMATALVFSMVFQSLICCCSNIGILPVVGLPFAFLSSGGTALTINTIICFFALYAVRKEDLPQAPETKEVNS